MPELVSSFFAPRRLSSDGSTDVFLKTDRVPRGEVWVINHVSFEDETTAYTQARLFRGTEQRPQWLSEELNPLAGVLYWDSEEYWLIEGEEMGVRFNGTTAADILTATFSGKRLLGQDHGSSHGGPAMREDPPVEDPNRA